MSNITTAQWLFEVPVTWRVPQYVTWSKETLNLKGLGMPTEDKHLNAFIYDEVSISVPTAQMAELYTKNRMRLIIEHPDQAIQVYERIMTHMRNWLNIVQQPFNLIARDVPMEGLAEFDALAAKIFTPANLNSYSVEEENKELESLKALVGSSVVPKSKRYSYNPNIFKMIQFYQAKQQRGKDYQMRHL